MLVFERKLHFQLVGPKSLPRGLQVFAAGIHESHLFHASHALGLQLNCGLAAHDNGVPVQGMNGPTGRIRIVELKLRSFERGESPGAAQRSGELWPQGTAVKVVSVDKESASKGISGGR